MSLNNLNKRNLFSEIKHQNRYAQLVEAQSPEPQETGAHAGETSVIAGKESTIKVNPTLSKGQRTTMHDELTNDIGNSIMKTECTVVELAANQDDEPKGVACGQEKVLEVSPGLPQGARKASQCSSVLMSTSFASSYQSTDSSRISNKQNEGEIFSTVPSTSSNNNNSNQAHETSSLSSAEASATSAVSVEACSSTSNGCRIKTNLTKTISRSMLELDQATQLDKFEVNWWNLTFSYKSNRLMSVLKRKQSVKPILCDISGSFRSNQLIAVIGPSGCGKTTLLQFLAGNNSSSNSSGKFNIVGLDEPKVAFIGQGDCLLPGLTARETLIYASRLQNTKPNLRTGKPFDHNKHIQSILEELGLTECSDRSVTKLSGGQAKRVTIAQELLYPTNLLILDEVTSGLDASTSYSIVKLLKQLVSDHEYPMSIVMSIHQPSAKLFSVFDQVYVMSEGCCLYEGGCQVDDINSYLKQFNLECPKFNNIADYLIEIASNDLSNCNRDGIMVKEQMIQFQRKRYQMRPDDTSKLNCLESRADKRIKRAINDGLITYEPAAGDVVEVIDNGDFEDLGGKDQSQRIPMLPMKNSRSKNLDLYSAIEKARGKRERPFWNHFLVHLSRSLVRIRRSYILTYLQLITYILLGLQLATFYGPNIGSISGCPQLPMSFLTFVFSNEAEDNTMNLEMRRIQENMNFLLVACMTATFAALEITVITFPLEAKTVKREWRNGWYRVSSYFMGRTLADLPFQLTFVIAFCFVIYTLTGQIGLTSWRFGSFVLTLIMTALIAQAVGFIFGAIFMDNLPAAVFTAPLCVFPALLFSGFFSRVSQIPVFYKPMTYISHFRYAFDTLLVSLYGFDRCNCDQVTLVAYHEVLNNQTDTIRDMFRSLFGSVECNNSPTASPLTTDENSIEDLITRTSQEGSLLNSMMLQRTTALPKLIGSSSPLAKSVEDALVESVFEHMNRTTDDPLSSSSGSPEAAGLLKGANPMDLLVNKFSTRITSVLNSRSNFGHPVPVRCEDFNSYLMTEFDLHNDDLMFGLIMLFIFVILSRLLCNILLNFTIASHAN